MARAFAPNEQLASLPIDVVQRHEHDLARTEAQSGQDQQDGEIALAGGFLREPAVSIAAERT